jgi:hypothetical protein
MSGIVVGVDTTDQRDFLASQGCHARQGFCNADPRHWMNLRGLRSRAGNSLTSDVDDQRRALFATKQTKHRLVLKVLPAIRNKGTQMTWLLWLGLVPCSLVVVAVGLRAYGANRWTTITTQSLTRRLEATRIAVRAPSQALGRFDSRELEGLPAPVQRYFRAVLKEGQPIIAAVRLELSGTFNFSATGEQWKPFTSMQRVITRRPGFLWDAQIAMLPGLPVRVVDSYIAGQGLLRAAILGLFTMADVSGGGEIARGEFMRFFAEAAWYPTALLPSQGVRWEAVDDHSAKATLVDGPLTLTLLFRFNDAGLIDSFRAEARGGMVDKVMVMAPWEGKWSNYQSCGGMTVPFTGEVAWMRPQGRRCYFIGTVGALTYEFSP